MSEFDVILRMDWLTAYRVVIDCERRRVTAYSQDGICHAPISGPTRLANPNRFPGRETQDWDSLPDFFFFFKANWHLWVWPTSYNNSQHHIHLQSPIYKFKTVLLHLQIRARNLHVVNPYKCVGPTVCGSLQMSSSVPTRIKNPC